MLHLAYQTFHQVSLPVQIPVISMRLFAIGARRNDRQRPAISDSLSKLIRVVSSVGNHILAVHPVYELVGLCDVMVLSCCKGESQWVAQSIHTYVNLRAEATPASAERLRLLPPFSHSLPQHRGERVQSYCL